MADQATVNSSFRSAYDPTAVPRPLVDWGQVTVNLHLMNKQASVIGTPPESPHRGLRQRLKRTLAVCVLRLSRFITLPQRLFNAMMMTSVTDLANGLKVLEQAHRFTAHRLANEVLGRLQALERSVSHLQSGQAQQDGRIALFLEEARRRLPAALGAQPVERMAAEQDHALDALRATLEDEFRPGREETEERFDVYLALLREAGVGGDDLPVLDLCAGRGDWLAFLKAQGLAARGVDSNRARVEQCRGVEVREADALTQLRGLPDACLGSVTGFGLVEHLPFATLVQVLDEAVRVLKPGGAVILEAVNPENLLTGACLFHRDPTRHRPVPPATLRLLAEQRGLVRVEVVRHGGRGGPANAVELLPAEHFLAARLNPLIELVKAQLGAAADFAVVGRKA